jgi:hypothetical protein
MSCPYVIWSPGEYKVQSNAHGVRYSECVLFISRAWLSGMLWYTRPTQGQSGSMKRFYGQEKHLLALLFLLVPVIWFAGRSGALEGEWLGVATPVWFWLAVAIPPIHQFGAMLFWRLELHGNILSNRLGGRAFPIYLMFFIPGLVGRPLSVIALAISDRNTLPVAPWILDAIALAMVPFLVYMFYSIVRYFGFKRASGADHFFQEYRTLPLVREGIYRFIPNAMYTVGSFMVWMPGLIWASPAALLVAGFQHVLLWAHYFFTEKPDMRIIYGVQ